MSVHKLSVDSTVTCFCKYVKLGNLLSDDELFAVAMKCKEICKFCKLCKPDILYLTIKRLKYHQIKEILGFDTILKNPFILHDIVIRYCDNISFEDLSIILEQKSLTDMPVSAINKIHYNVLTVAKTSSMDIKDSRSLVLLQKIIANNSLLIKHYETIMSFILDMLSSRYINKISDLEIHLADFSMLLELALKSKKKKDHEADYYYCIDKIVREGSFFRLTQRNYSLVWTLSSETISRLFKKLDNIVEFISNASHPESGEKINLVINPLNVFETLIMDGSDESESLLEYLASRRYTFIEYKTENGVGGLDAGGLTRDLYFLIAGEIIKNCEEVDNYLMPKRDSTLHPSVWKFFGVMTARSMFRETLSPGINMHPILCYLMLYGMKNIKLKDFFDSLLPFYIDYIESMRIVLKMNIDAYREFMELQCEDIVPKSGYIGRFVYDKYLYSSVIHFINGFRMAFSKYYYTRYLTLITFHRYIKGDWKYDILGNSPHSMKNNLILKRDKDYEEQIIVKGTAFYDKIKFFEKTFLKVLDDLNNTNSEKLRLFMKFWFGTASINTFNGNAPIVYITNNNLYGCFKSNTCFNKLHIESSFISCDVGLYENLLKLIDNTLENQKLSESVGYRMQFM